MNNPTLGIPDSVITDILTPAPLAFAFEDGEPVGGIWPQRFGRVGMFGPEHRDFITVQLVGDPTDLREVNVSVLLGDPSTYHLTNIQGMNIIVGVAGVIDPDAREWANRAIREPDFLTKTGTEYKNINGRKKYVTKDRLANKELETYPRHLANEQSPVLNHD